MGQTVQVWIGIIAYCAVVNFIAYIAMARDKAFARSGKRRIRERTLFLIAFLGGALGMLAGMRRFRHKTKHLSFRLLIPLFALVQCALLVWLRLSEARLQPW